ncbi:MAG: phage virion morphogenesis protein [Methylophaga sp.]|nr:phage virion morphogenesis protein [Methylophaga sp.]
MGLSLKYSIDDKAAREFLKRLGNVDTAPMFDEIGAYLDSEVALRFAQSIDWEGNPLQPSQRAEREGGKTLVDFGHLRDSYTHNVFADGSGVEHGSNSIYAAIHQFGGKTGRNLAVEMPIRAVMGINADDEAEIDGIVEDYYRAVMP